MNEAPASAGALFLCLLYPAICQAATSLCGSKLSALASCHIRE